MRKDAVVKELVRLARKAVAAQEATIGVHGTYCVIVSMVETDEQDLKDYQRELSVAESQVQLKAMKLVKLLQGMGRRAKTLNVGVTPDEGKVGVVVEIRSGGRLTPGEQEAIYAAEHEGRL